MSVVCPACLPPDNSGCATCGGTWQVDEGVAAAYAQQYAEREAFISLQTAIATAVGLATTTAEAKSAVQAVLDQTP